MLSRVKIKGIGMANKRKKKPSERLPDLEAGLLHRLKKLLHFRDDTIPAGAIRADLSEQAENNSYSPPLYYEDVPFVCRDCGSAEVWKAEQQKWYYEIAKGPIYAGAVRCRDCRRKEQERKQQSRQPRRTGEPQG